MHDARNIQSLVTLELLGQVARLEQENAALLARAEEATRSESDARLELERIYTQLYDTIAERDAARAKIVRIENVINVGCGMPGRAKQAVLLDVISVLDGSAE